MSIRITGAVWLLIVLTWVRAVTADGSTGDAGRETFISAGTERDGVKTSARGSSTTTRPANRPALGQRSSTPTRYESRWVVACDGNSIVAGDEIITCGYATAFCAHRGEPGPLAYRWQRQVAPVRTEWRVVGSSCFGSVPPPGRPALTVEQVRSAFARTPFKPPVLRVQPPGGETLVNLPTFFEAAFPGPGYGLGQVHSVTLLGRSVRIRVASVRYVWEFGDGSAPITTWSAGGPWPDGDVSHTYSKPGVVEVRVSAVYRGEYAADGGPWQPVESPVTISAPASRLAVLTAHNRLVPL